MRKCAAAWVAVDWARLAYRDPVRKVPVGFFVKRMNAGTSDGTFYYDDDIAEVLE